ncbi:DNA-directed RNA polymerase subunit beta [Brevibacillus daliensis]|uniref:DNA-directed RNA polymerase subunit beta n=1 Tax=Brevibacillus daliensis TaxID=2892995 RepID=UPI001E294C9F|nr:DNA-directed RNA polymerase subunit beta [Brevibacillus daliensis]
MSQVKGRQELQDTVKKENGTPKEKKSWPKRLLKMGMVPLLLFFSMVIGLSIGYSVLGKMPLSQAFSIETYKHIFDLMFAGT